MKLLFIIAHKYYRGYETYLEYYINNIQTFYGDDANVLIVDNNSIYLQDIQEKISKYKNVEIIINTSDSKFELGAYKFGINYINEKRNEYEYMIFIQDTFVLKNKYDFNNLILNDVKACTIVSNVENINTFFPYEIRNILEPINMFNKLNDITFVWCVSFILHNSVLNDFMKLTNHIKIKIKRDSQVSERYLARILYHLNNDKNFDIDGHMDYLKYNCFTSNIYDKLEGNYFQKKIQSKNENTTDI